MHTLGPAYVLHSRPYRDTSALVDLLTLHHGLARVVWRGARGGRRSLAQPFVPLLVDLRGRGDLKTLNQAEVAGPHPLLQGQALFSGLYLNELLVRLLGPGETQPLLFAAYQEAIAALATGVAVEPVLRTFEWRLLDNLGYGFSLHQDALGQPLEESVRYVYVAESGLLPSAEPELGFSGNALLAVARQDWSMPSALMTAKKLMRQALAPLLGDRPLVSRQLFTGPGPAPREETDHD